jgi:hypothetical protein
MWSCARDLEDASSDITCIGNKKHEIWLNLGKYHY